MNIYTEIDTRNLPDGFSGGHSAFHRFDEAHPVPCPENHAGSDLRVFFRVQLGIAAADRDHSADEELDEMALRWPFVDGEEGMDGDEDDA